MLATTSRSFTFSFLRALICSCSTSQNKTPRFTRHKGCVEVSYWGSISMRIFATAIFWASLSQKFGQAACLLRSEHGWESVLPWPKNKKVAFLDIFRKDESRAYRKVLRVRFVGSKSVIPVLFRLRSEYLNLNVWLFGWRRFCNTNCQSRKVFHSLDGQLSFVNQTLSERREKSRSENSLQLVPAVENPRDTVKEKVKWKVCRAAMYVQYILATSTTAFIMIFHICDESLWINSPRPARKSKHARKILQL